jgi:hypothetical protein
MERRRVIFFLTKESTQNYETFNFRDQEDAKLPSNVPENRNERAKLVLFQTCTKKKFLNNEKTSLFDYVYKDICKLFFFLTLK